MRTSEVRLNNAIKKVESLEKKLIFWNKKYKRFYDQLVCIGFNPESYTQEEKFSDGDRLSIIYDMEMAKKSVNKIKADIKEANNKVEECKIKKAEDDERCNVPIVPAVEEFLSNWTKNAKEYYMKKTRELLEYKKSAGRNVDYVEYNNHIRNNYDNATIEFSRYTLPERVSDAIDKVLEKEVERKRIDLYERCSKVVGKITDASNLRIGNNLSINGFIIGEAGKANVETIMAGGYNIQVLHYRVLVNKA